MTPIFEDQSPKTRPVSIKTRVIWVPGKYIYIYIICTCASIEGYNYIDT